MSQQNHPEFKARHKAVHKTDIFKEDNKLHNIHRNIWIVYGYTMDELKTKCTNIWLHVSVFLSNFPTNRSDIDLMKALVEADVMKLDSFLTQKVQLDDRKELTSAACCKDDEHSSQEIT